MKHVKRVMALIVAMVMLVSAMNISAFAAAEKTITINGLEAGDNVKY